MIKKNQKNHKYLKDVGGEKTRIKNRKKDSSNIRKINISLNEGSAKKRGKKYSYNKMKIK